MNEALEAGFLDGKLCNPVTVKFNDNTNQAIETICNAQGITVAEWLRDLAIKNLVARKREFHRMEKLWGQTKKKPDGLGQAFVFKTSGALNEIKFST